ncbi:MAG TPA: hypothetical protein VFU63_01610 [Ktedonobacterales bacterium]|nr:hypothetical protein [Ktedonobacterales bacterium]
MDSQNPQHYEQSASAYARQDAQYTAASAPAMQHMPAVSEATTTYQEPRFAAGAAPAFTNTSAETATEAVSRDATPIPLDDGPVTVPILGTQPITKRWEQVLDDDVGDQDEQRVWPDDGDSVEDHLDTYDSYEGYDASAYNTSAYNYEDLDLDSALGITDETFIHDEAFAFRERSWDGWRRSRKAIFVLLSLAAMFAVAIVGASMAATYMRQATQHLSVVDPVPTTGSFNGGLVVQPAQETAVPTPQLPKYQMGAWMSNNAPSGGSVKVFVRLSQDVQPVVGVPVKLTVQVPGGTLRYGPTKTDAYGLVTFTVRFGGASGPCFVTASAKIGSEEYTTSTVFVPI